MHALITVAVPFEPTFTDAVEAELDRLGNPARGEPAEALDAAEFVHFISITVLPADQVANAYLVIELSADGGAADVVQRLCASIGDEIKALLQAAQISLGRRRLPDFLLRHSYTVGQGWFSTPGLNFDGTPGMSVARIRREEALMAEVSALLQHDAPSDCALHTLQWIRSTLWESGKWKWAFVPEPTPILSGNSKTTGPAVTSRAALFRALKAGPALVVALVASFLWPFLALVLLVLCLCWYFSGFASGVWAALGVLIVELVIGFLAYRRLRRLEQSDRADDIAPNAGMVAEIMRRESFAMQNHMAAASTIKPGRLRRLTLRIGLWLAGQLAIHFSRPSFLADTGVIHFARWILLPGTDKLLFFSNYDGAWESYLEDFIEKAAQGVTGIWSNTTGFPRTANLFGMGATDGNRLRRWTRRQQHPTRFWYTAYPSLTLGRIRLNAAVRQGIASAQTEAEAAEWLSCFGSAPRAPASLEIENIPTLAFGGLRRLRYARCLFLRLSPDGEAIKAWLRQVEPDVSYGVKFDKARAPASALLLGLKQSAVGRLGMDQALMTFPVAYQHGSAAPWRARALGDCGASDPHNWMWGGTETDVDAVLVLYDVDEANLDRRVSEQSAALEQRGHSIYLAITLKPAPQDDEPVREPFGFVDGISDPAIRGVGKWWQAKHHNHLVEAGEFILGYPDNSGTLPCSPTVAAGDDPTDILPALEDDPFRQRPEFAVPRPSGQHDLGFNGSFLVIRQLEQDVEAFDAFCRQAAEAATKNGRVPQSSQDRPEDWVAAKLVGRWKDGASLVRHPHGPGAPGTDPDNEFLFGTEDGDGMRCPFGAHIRRANPRDTFDPGSTIQLNITNRHRILRVGRAYLPQKDLTKPGLMFMCLNSDIERQFEFVQQTWVLGHSFNGLENEVDPLLGPAGMRRILTVPTPAGPLRLCGMQEFVRVLGSGYFFLPGRKAMRYLAR